MLAVWIFSFPALTDGILDTVETENILVLFLGGNEGFKYSEKIGLVLYQREHHAKNSYKNVKNELWSRLAQVVTYDTSSAFLGQKIWPWII